MFDADTCICSFVSDVFCYFGLMVDINTPQLEHYYIILDMFRSVFNDNKTGSIRFKWEGLFTHNTFCPVFVVIVIV